MWVMLTMLAVIPAGGLGAGYCSSNTFGTNSSWLQFTKEPIPLEYAFENSFKSIHCCGKGYRSIEWFKNDVAYPWSANVSNFILYPEAANQTLYTRDTSRHDTGNYTCRMSNETHSQYHTVHLEVIDKAPTTPKTMFISTDQWVEEGNQLRLYCEALVGRSYLADAKNDLRWQKVWPNDTEGELLSTQREVKTFREDNQDILGSYLFIPLVSSVDYGTYACAVHSNEVVSKRYVTVHYKTLSASVGESRSVSWRLVVLLAAGVVVVLGSGLALHRTYTPRVLLAARIVHARATRDTQRTTCREEFDVLVSYTGVDSGLVHGALINTLTIKYMFRALPVCLSPQPEHWYSELSGEVGRCRSLVCVMSPRQYSPAQLLLALRQLRALPLAPVVIMLQDLPKLKREAKDDRGESLPSVLRQMQPVAWRHMHDTKFWTTLRLRLALPLPPPPQNKSNKEPNDAKKNSFSGSLDALV